jgi:nucleoid-associated protein YgaU
MENLDYEEYVFDGVAGVDPADPAEEPVKESKPKAKKKEAETYVVVASDTWGRLVEKHGKDIAEKNGRTFRDPLVAGTVLRLS